MQKKTIKPDMLAKFKAGEIYVDPKGDLEGIQELCRVAYPEYRPAPSNRLEHIVFTGGHDSWLWGNKKNREPNEIIIPLSEMYETAEDEFVMGEEVEVRMIDSGDWYPRMFVARNPKVESRYKWVCVEEDGSAGAWVHCRRPIRKQTVSLEDLIATYAEKHGIAPEAITVDND